MADQQQTVAPEYLVTDRLKLRTWTSADLDSFAKLNCCPRVMEYFPRGLTREETRGFLAKIQSNFERDGFGLWAVELLDCSEFIGFVGLSQPGFKAHFTPCVEIGWRLAADHWGKGYAVEGARASLQDVFTRELLSDVVSFTSKINLKSIRVMEKLGMQSDPVDDFHHPFLPDDHNLSLHVLYRLKSSDWE